MCLFLFDQTTISHFPMCDDRLLKPHWMKILVYFSRYHVNPPYILLWQYYCAWRYDTFMGNFSLFYSTYKMVNYK